MSMIQMTSRAQTTSWLARWGQAMKLAFTRAEAQSTTLSPAAAARRFEQALAADSNIAADWVSCALLMTGITEKRYCLHRALVIDADSEWAARELRQLNRTGR